jgi:radical SAM protein with 4Fe4S-binding SPASM domain
MERVPVIQTLALELTNKCQNSCSMCWSHCPKMNKPREEGFMEYELFRKTLQEFIMTAPTSAKLKVALSYGGESLLHPGYDRFLKLVISIPRITPMIYTNGLLLWEHRKIMNNLRAINVSVHSQGYSVLISTLINLQWKDRITAHIVEGEFSPDEQTEIIKEVKKYAEVEIHPQITEDLKSPLPSTSKCSDPFHYIAVLWNGETLPCCHLLSPGEFTMGNVKDGLYEVWMGEKYERLRQGDLTNLPCHYCKLFDGVLNNS